MRFCSRLMMYVLLALLLSLARATAPSSALNTNVGRYTECNTTPYMTSNLGETEQPLSTTRLERNPDVTFASSYPANPSGRSYAYPAEESSTIPYWITHWPGIYRTVFAVDRPTTHMNSLYRPSTRDDRSYETITAAPSGNDSVSEAEWSISAVTFNSSNHRNAYPQNSAVNFTKKIPEIDVTLANGEHEVLTARKYDNHTNRNNIVESSTAVASTSDEIRNITNDNNIYKVVRRPGEVSVIRGNESENDSTLFEEFKSAAAQMEKEFYLTTFRTLAANSPAERRERGVSFVLSSAWLHALLLLLSGEVDADVRSQLDNVTHFPRTLEEKDKMLKAFVAQMPPSSENLKFTWSNRLVLGPGVEVSEAFRARARDTLGMKVDSVAGDNVTQLVDTLNDMVQRDTGAALRGTFEEADVAGGVRALLLSTVYVRGAWRAPVTLLNGTGDFRDAREPPYRQTRMFRLNDLVGYARVPEWDAEVVEIPYATANLSLLAVVPRAAEGLAVSARGAAAVGVRAVRRRLRTRRVAVTLPLFTLRMTLLLPTKLKEMGAPALVSSAEGAGVQGLRLSHAVQRLMFWADAGRNAYKDDGVEWDPRPEFSLVIDRPYFFMVIWNDIVLMTGNFVL